jgi:hypothetical protein
VQHLLYGGTGNSQEITEVDHRQPGASTGVTPLLSEVVGLRPTDAEQPAGFGDGQERGNLVTHRHNSQLLTTKLLDDTRNIV